MWTIWRCEQFDDVSTRKPIWRMRYVKFSGHFEIQTDHLISAKRPDLVIVKKKQKKKKEKKQTTTYWIVDFAVSVDRRVILKEIESRDKYQDLAKQLKKIYGKWRWRWYQL